jgi:hypothetical protein
MQANKPTFFRLDPERTLAENLRGKTVREFPTVVVLLPGEAEGYSIVDAPVRQPEITTDVQSIDGA